VIAGCRHDGERELAASVPVELRIVSDALRPAIVDAALHFPPSLRDLATSVAVTGATIGANGFGGTVHWSAPADGARLPLLGGLSERLALVVRDVSVTFASSALVSGVLTVDFEDLEVPIPGQAGTALILSAQAGVSLRLTGEPEGLGFTLEGVTPSLRWIGKIVRPHRAQERWIDAVVLSLGPINVGIGPGGDFILDLSALSLDLPRSMIGESGVIVSAQGVTAHVGAGPPPPARPAGGMARRVPGLGQDRQAQGLVGRRHGRAVPRAVRKRLRAQGALPRAGRAAEAPRRSRARPRGARRLHRGHLGVLE